MPHYADGSEVKVSDLVKGPHENSVLVGTVAKIMPGSDTCNMLVAPALRVHEEGSSRFVREDRSGLIYCTCKEFAKIALVLLSVTIGVSLLAAPADAACGFRPFKAIRNAIANGVERRQARRAEGRGAARLLPRNWGR